MNYIEAAKLYVVITSWGGGTKTMGNRFMRPARVKLPGLVVLVVLVVPIVRRQSPLL